MFSSLFGDVNRGQGCSAVVGVSQTQAGRLTSHGERLRAERHAVLMPAVGTAVGVAGTADAADPSGLLARLRALGRGEMATTDRREVFHALGSRRPPLQHGRGMAGPGSAIHRRPTTIVSAANEGVSVGATTRCVFVEPCGCAATSKGCASSIDSRRLPTCCDRGGRLREQRQPGAR